MKNGNNNLVIKDIVSWANAYRYLMGPYSRYVESYTSRRS